MLGWLVPRDPRRLALLFLGALALCLAGGGAMALLMRVELLGPAPELLAAEAYGQVLTLHGALVLVVVLPLIPATLGNFAVPLQTGGRGAAWPWLGVAGFYGFVAAAWLVVEGVRAPATTAMGGLPWKYALGIAGLALSAGLTALGQLGTIRRGRRDGAPLSLFVWASLVGAVATLVAVGLLCGVVAPLAVREPFMAALLTPTITATIVGLALVPALGVVCEVLGEHARGVPLRGTVLAALMVLAAAALPLAAIDAEAERIGDHVGRAAVLLLLGAWSLPLIRGGGRGTTPLLYTAGAIVALVLAGLTGALMSRVSAVALSDTYFEVGHLHLRVQVVVLAWLAGLHHWWSRLTGCTYNENAGRVGAALVVGGTLTHAIAALLLGSAGMPRRYWTYLPEFAALHGVASVGAFVSGVGLVWVACSLGVAWGRRAPRVDE